MAPNKYADLLSTLIIVIYVLQSPDDEVQRHTAFLSGRKEPTKKRKKENPYTRNVPSSRVSRAAASKQIVIKLSHFTARRLRGVYRRTG